MDSTILAALVGIFSAIFTSLVTHLLLLKRIRREAMEPFRREFYQKQLLAYQKIWSYLGPTSRFSSENTVLRKQKEQHYVDIENAAKFSSDLRSFFFSEHGIFLSRTLRKSIFDTLDFLEKIINQQENPNGELIAISKTQSDNIRSYFTGIHTAARRDVALADIAFPKSELGLEE